MDILTGLVVILTLAVAVMPLTLRLHRTAPKKESKHAFIKRAYRK